MNDFSVFTKQSSKGIIILFIASLYAFIKKVFILIPMLLIGKSNPLKASLLIYLAIAYLIFLLVKSILLYQNFEFKIKDQHFILKQGIFKKTQISIPFDRIQNVNFKQNFIQQLINVTQVDIETAGAKKTEVSIKALSRNKAEAIKYTIFKQNETANSNQTELSEIKKPLLKISINDLVKVSITENHFKSFAVFLAFSSMMYQQIREFLKDFTLKETVGIDLEKTSNSLNGFILLAFIAIIIALVISFIRVFSRHYNLTLTIKNNVLEIIQGLFTKKNHILKKNKIQYLTITTNPLKKILGISNVIFRQVSSGLVKTNKLTRIVGCKKEHINTIYTDCNMGKLSAKHKPNNYYLTQMGFRSTLLILFINLLYIIPLYLNKELYLYRNYFYINILILVFVGILIYKKYKKSYFQFNDKIIVIGKGQISTDTTFFEHFKIQSIQLKQTIFQKQKKVSDLVLITATGKIKIPCLNQLNAIKLYNYLIYNTEISTKKWM